MEQSREEIIESVRDELMLAEACIDEAVRLILPLKLNKKKFALFALSTAVQDALRELRN